MKRVKSLEFLNALINILQQGMEHYDLKRENLKGLFVNNDWKVESELKTKSNEINCK